MYRLVLSCCLLLTAVSAGAACPALLDHSFRKLGEPVEQQRQSLCTEHAGKVILAVNTASYCGYTSQYRGLEALQQRFAERGFTVLGFPSNDFAQEPGSEQEIKAFCELTYGVQFPLYEKTAVSGTERAHPFYRHLAERGGSPPRWNFHKYLIDRSGERVQSFPTQIRPDDPALVAAIEALL